MIDGVTQSQASQGLGAEISSAGELRSDFLTLLIAQLSNQDPLSPMDNEAMVQQLATLSQLEQLERVNSNLNAQMGYSQSLNNTMMMNVAGKRVTVAGNGVELDDGEASRVLVRVPESGTIYARVLDENGDVVRSLDGQAVTPGFNTVEFDGKDSEGKDLPDGSYSIEISATDTDGAFMQSVTFSSGIVETVQFENNYVLLEVNGRLYTPADVVEVGAASQDPIVVQVDGGSGSGGGGTGDPEDGLPIFDEAPTVPPLPPTHMSLGGIGAHPLSDRSPWEALLRIR